MDKSQEAKDKRQEAGSGSSGWPLARPLLRAVLAVCVFALLFTSTVTALAYNPRFYAFLHERNRVAERAGAPWWYPDATAHAMISYFGSPASDLPGAFVQYSLPADFFNERELKHMKDVRDLIWFDQWVQGAAAAVGIAALVAVAFLVRRDYRRFLLGSLLAGSALTIGFIVLLGLFSMLDFQAFWLMFHLLSFTNDLWQLDPRTDNLIRMFPAGFFFDAVVLGAMLVGLEAIILAAVSAGLLWGKHNV